MDPAPAMASLGRNLNLSLTSNALPGASAAELTLNLISQEEAAPTIQRSGTSKTDTKSRVAKHNVQTVVRVNSMRLFDLSSFSAELRRGGESIPLIPPYVELPVIGSLIRLPMRPQRIYHRSFAIVSAVVLPTSADLAASVIPDRDVMMNAVTHKLMAKAPAGAGFTATYTVIAELQSGIALTSSATVTGLAPSTDHPVTLKWDSVGLEAQYRIYRQTGPKIELLEELRNKTHYEDSGDPGTVAAIPPGTTASGLSTITPASFLSGGVAGFHKARLECMAREASGTPLAGCDTQTLANFPLEN